MFKRVVIKLSGEYLAGEMSKDDGGIPVSCVKHVDYPITAQIVSDIIKVMKNGVQTALVVGGGNFWRGRDAAAGFDRSKADNMGMLASVMNGILLSERFAARGVRAHVMTPFAVGGMTQIYNQDIADEYLKKGDAVIFSGGTGQPYFSTDTISVIRAAELKADRVLFAKGVDGVCDKNPNTAESGGFKVFREITASEIIEKNLEVVDAAAMFIAREHCVTTALFDIRAENAIEIACSGDSGIKSIGTAISYL